MGTDWIEGLRVVDLKEELKKRELPVTGKKADLVERLTEAVLAEATQGKDKEEAAPDARPEAEAVSEAQPEGVTQAAETTDGDAKPSAPAEPAQSSGERSSKEPAKAEAAAEPSKEAAKATAEGKVTSKEPAGEAPAKAEEGAKQQGAAKPEEAANEQDAAPMEVEEATEPERAPEPEAKPEPARLPSMQAALLAAKTAAVAEPEAEEAVDFDADLDEPEAKPRREEGEGQKQPRDSSAAADAPAAKRLKQDDGTPAPASGGRRKREPITFKPRERASTGSAAATPRGDGASPATTPAEEKAASGKRVSVFNRIAGQEAEPAPAGRGAPPTRVKATRALLVTGFIRPFTVAAATNLFKSYGEVEKMWMPPIRDKAYVIYASEEAAEAARQATHGLEWPQGNRTSLRPKFVAVEEAATVIDSNGKEGLAAPAKPAVGAGVSVAAAATAAAGAPLERRLSNNNKAERLGEAGEGRRGRGPVARPAPPPKVEKRVLGLEDLFRKTEATPHLYWLPLTDEQVAARRAKSERPEEVKQRA